MAAMNSHPFDRDSLSELPTSEARSVAVLQRIYRDEMIAVETYELAVRETRLGAAMQQDLLSCQSSHRDRLVAVAQRLADRGAECPHSNDARGIFVLLLEGAAVNLSDKAALDLLRQWETEKVSDYQTQDPALDPKDADFVIRELLPAQINSHRVIVRLSERLHGRGAAQPPSERGDAG